MAGKSTTKFNYESIPIGYYDKILDNKNGMRKFWHWHKFDAVKRVVGLKGVVVDVGCFAGTFIGAFLNNNYSKKIGVDILPDQIEYANHKYSSKSTEFLVIESFFDIIEKIKDEVNTVTFIEVIEHLDEFQIKDFFESVDKILAKDSEVVITTPNYLSVWPLLEVIVNKLSSVKYEEQHITKFTYFNIEKKLENIYPGIWEKYFVEIKTTTHFLSPFIALLSYSYAVKFSNYINASKWRNPFGAMILLKIKRSAK